MIGSKEAKRSCFNNPPKFKKIWPPETSSGMLCYPAMEMKFNKLNNEVYKYDESKDAKLYNWLREKFYHMYGLNPPPKGTPISKKRFPKAKRIFTAEEKTKMLDHFKEDMLS